MDNCASEKKRTGCCIMILFRRWPKRPPTPNSSPNSNGINGRNITSPNLRRRTATDEAATFKVSETPAPKMVERPITNPQMNTKTNRPQYQTIGKTFPSGQSALTAKAETGHLVGTGPLVQKNMSISRELELVMPDYRGKDNSTLVRASSSNMMVFGNLGNIKQPGNGKAKASSPTNYASALEYLPMTAKEKASSEKGVNANRNVNVAGNNAAAVEKDNSGETAAAFCRALSKRLNPEELKVMGNEQYKKGNFAEALALYDRAIVLDPDKASYRSNKSAALIGLGQLLEAVEECREAVRLEPSYSRAHHRLATLFLRLGEAEKAQKHYKLSGSEASPKEITQAESIKTHLIKCKAARKLKDWQTMLEEARRSVSSGADSAPQLFALQAEALLKLCKHDEADSALSRAPAFDADASTKFFGAAGNAYFFLIRAQVDMAAGRFENAVEMAQRAAWLDSSNKEVGVVVRRTRVVASARTNGNNFFKASKFSEACAEYGEGLEYDAYNSVLLCNRAACRLKLGQLEKAIEDCTTALNVRPSYSKARQRRADCNAKLERWEASMKDYEVLIREMPGDDEVRKALLEVQTRLKKQSDEDGNDMVEDEMVIVPSNIGYGHLPLSPSLKDRSNRGRHL